jgi:hypothetical protein
MALSDVWISQDYGLTWQKQYDAADWGPRAGHAAAFDGSDTLYLVGGVTCSQAGPCGSGAGFAQLDFLRNDVWQSSDYGLTWSQVLPAVGESRWTGRQGFSLVAEHLVAGKLYLINGWANGITLQDVWKSENGGVSWTPQTLVAPFPGRKYHATVFYPDDTAMLVLGGLNASGATLNDVWASTDKGQTWSQRASFPGARSNFGAVIDGSGSLMLVGGIPFSTSVQAASCVA